MLRVRTLANTDMIRREQIKHAVAAVARLVTLVNLRKVQDAGTKKS